MLKKIVLLFITLLCFSCVEGSRREIFADAIEEKRKADEEERRKKIEQYLKAQKNWVDSVFSAMSIDQRIGQLFMVAAYSNKNEEHYKQIDELITKYHIGGLIFFQGGPARQILLTNRYQTLAQTKLLIGIDGEWGLGMRLDSTISFPRQMTLGAIQDDNLIYEMGAEVAKQCKRIGVHVNFAPVVDVNINPNNPVIGTRSFGENKINVAKKGVSYAKGMQHNGIIANAKHFPGHGDTDKDSHYTLPSISHDKRRLNEIELYPFKALIADSIMSIMVAHLNIPAYDSALNRPTTLSPAVVTGLLRDSLKFSGLAFTDALNMKGVTNHYKPGEADLQAFIAGNDVLLYPNDVQKGIDAFKKALTDSVIFENQIEARVKKILRAKYFAGLAEWDSLSLDNLSDDLINPKAIALKAKLYQQAVTIVKNDTKLLPIITNDTLDFASVMIGAGADNAFQTSLSQFAKFKHYQVGKTAGKDIFNSIVTQLKKSSVVVVGIVGMNNQAGKQYGMNEHIADFIKKLETQTKVVTVVFGNPYSLKYLGAVQHLVCAYEEDSLMQKAVPNILFGAIKASAKLPVSASPELKEGTGINLASLGRFGYGLPETVGLNSIHLQKIDTIIEYAIKEKAMPGAQLLVAKDGIIVYQKSYGYQTYEKRKPINNDSYYDIASLTKVVGTLQAVMWLVDNKMLDLEKQLRYYLPETDTTNKGSMVLKEILAHQAGLLAFIPFQQEFMDRKNYKAQFISENKSPLYPIKITPYLYATEAVRDTIWSKVLQSRLANKKNKDKSTYEYWYSDLGLIIIQKVIEKLTNQPLDVFLQEKFFNPLQLKLTFNPLDKKILSDNISPTEMDITFRKSLIHGTVHDPAAALCGGVAGHAGIFSNAYDVAVIMQMNLQEGSYNGTKYLTPKTVNTFNNRPYIDNNNRRGIGWDKPDLNNTGITGTSIYCSDFTFGHTGFTGTCAWADPACNLVYVFLSNRVYPTADNKKLANIGVRTKIQDVIYEALGLTNKKS